MTKYVSKVGQAPVTGVLVDTLKANTAPTPEQVGNFLALRSTGKPIPGTDKPVEFDRLVVEISPGRCWVLPTGPKGYYEEQA